MSGTLSGKESGSSGNVNGERQRSRSSESSKNPAASTSVTVTGYIYSATIVHNYSATYYNKGLFSSTSTTNFQVVSTTQFAVTQKL